ncbi:MAG: tetratricopeptide repeat protein [Candidatus Rifleibacteriota bacterium]
MKVVHLIPVFLFSILIVTYRTNPCLALDDDDSWLYNRQGIYKASRGDYESAIRDFEKACRLNPFNDKALSNLACAHNNLGVLLASQKKYSEAIRHFNAAKQQKPEDISIRLNLLSTLVTLKNSMEVEKEAEEILKLRPTDVATVLKVAAAFQNTENQAAAQTTLEKLSDKVPDNPRVHETLGRLLYKTGNLDEARFHLARAKALEPENQKLDEFLAQVKKEAEVESTAKNFSSIHFSLTCDESFSDEWAENLLDLLEEAYEDIGARLNFYPNQRSHVLVFQTEDFRSVHDLPEWAGGVYDGKIRLPVPTSTVSPTYLRGAIRHEYTHHVIFLLAAGNCPVWLNEGLAQIFEFDSEITDIEVPQNPNMTEMNEFANIIRTSKDRRKVAALYKQANLLSIKLVHEYGWHSISDVLEKMSRGFSFEEACRQIIGLPPNEVIGIEG